MAKNIKITVSSHILVWLVLFSMPYILSYGLEQEIDRVFAHFWIPLVFYAAVFYLNYFLLIDRFLFSRKRVLFVCCNILLIAFFLLSRELIEGAFFQDISRTSNNGSEAGRPWKMFIYVQTLSYLAPLLFSITIKTTKRWVKTETERKEADNQKLKSELQHLHYQLQPHFFFNSLNNIYALVDVSPDQAKTSIHSLSKLMRYMLYETNLELVPLSKEIEFMKKYVELMKLRVSNKTVVDYSFPSENQDVQIAPLLFISLIENAFKHGVSASKGSLIKIFLKCDKGVVKFSISNDNFPKRTDDKSGSGIGLKNLQKRLKLLYRDKYNFSTKIEDNRFLVDLEIKTN